MPYSDTEYRESNTNYLNKDFTQLKQSLINYARSYFPNTYRDFNESSPGMMLMEMSAHVGDTMSFYIDNQYREMLLPLAEERRNIINMAKMFGYRVKPIVPAYADITFTSDVPSQGGENSDQVDYSTAAIYNTGIKIQSNTDSNIYFETLEPIDFRTTGSNDTQQIASLADSGLVDTYKLSRTVKAVSGETTTLTFNITNPIKFRKITLPETNVIDIISCIDSNGNNWYEVDFLAQDKVPISTHYSQDSRTNAYMNLETDVISDISVPYSLSYIKTPKRFVVETNPDETTSLVFGNGVQKSGDTIDSGYLDLEQAGITVPGGSKALADAINPLLGDEYSTLGETPIQTSLTIKYRVGGGISANVGAGSLNQLPSNIDSFRTEGTVTIGACTNNQPARGGRSKEEVTEIRERAKAFFSTQNRCVTKEDYEARVMNMSSKFGGIAKVYAARTSDADIIYTPTVAEVQGYFADVNSLLSDITVEANGVNSSANHLSIIENFQALSPQPSLGGLSSATLSLGTVTLSLLSYDINGNLVGNPIAGTTGYESFTDGVPKVLSDNVKNYLEEFRILTDSIMITDGYIINFGVFFDVISHRSADKNEVKLRCIDTIRKYFLTEKMQFGQPIFVSQLEYELMGLDGVRGINYVTITQNSDYNGYSTLNDPTYLYSYDPSANNSAGGFVTTGGTDGYGYKFDFQSALVDGVIVPPSPTNPGVFELKNPNQNIKGVVR